MVGLGNARYRGVGVVYPFLAYFLIGLSMHLAGSYYSVYLYSYGVGEALIVLSFSINMVAQSIAVYPGGVFGDRFGRLKAVSIGVILYGLGVSMLWLAPCSVTAIVTAILCGFGTSFIISLEAWLADVYSGELGKVLSMFRAIYFASGFVGGVLALLVSGFGIRYVFLVSMLTILIAIAPLMMLPDVRGSKSVREIFRVTRDLFNRVFISILLYSSLISIPLILFYSLWSIILTERGFQESFIGLAYSVLLLSATIGSIATYRLLKTINSIALLSIASISLGLLLIASNTIQSLSATLTIFLLLEFVLGILTASLSYVKNRVVPSTIRASALSLIDLANTFTTSIFAPIITKLYPTTTLIVAGIIAIISTSLLITTKKTII
ncbi:major facilitator superfamily MFS_1 [Ignisphaera aggregans DSM 17230]|uniref:Major facilitator superfamily MFS_1 n=1 Tax=Ignisphaera aggregans (strain DSM 17230 / JCM 13409 / AQ1.S1) TaxID=583356 RepID=E0STJ9_IGNAA|nr:major facilitator superfamily MFS_1 [Ignisphaera aggregans DSM 17230]